MADALQNPHPEVPFTSVGNDTILALVELAAIINLKLHQTPSPTPRDGPPPVFQRPCLAESSDQIMNSPIPASRQTRSQTTIHTQAIPKVQLLLRVVTPRSLHPSPPRVPTHSRSLSPHNLSQDDFLGVDTANMAIALGENHWSQQQYAALMKDPRLQPLWTRGFGNECGRLFQGVRDIPGTDTCFFIKLTNISKDRKITYGKVVCDYKRHKKEKERVRITVKGGTHSATQATSPLPQQISQHSKY
jgi:hypothetical protein